MKRLAIIPARGGSKRIKNKNIREFNGKPIISYILETAKKSNLFNKIHVSTDDEKIIRIVNNLGFQVDFKRPKSLADDHTPIMPVLKFVVEEYCHLDMFFDQIWMLMPCAPFIKVKDLVSAEKSFQKSNNKKSLLAVTEYPVPIEWAYRIDKKKSLKPVNPGLFAKRSQDIKKSYFDTGTFAILSSETILDSDNAGRDDQYIAYIMPKSSTVDIDEEEDFIFAEKLYKLTNIISKNEI